MGTASRARGERPDRARAIQRFSRRNVSRADVMRRRNGIKQAVGHATRYSHAKQMCSGSVIAARILDLLRQRAVLYSDIQVFAPAERNEPRKK